MAETEENGGMGDWRNLISNSPNGNGNGLFSGFVADGFGGSSFNGGNGGDGVGLDGGWKPGKNGGGGGGSIAERRAARCGFNAPRLNTARFRTISPLSSPSILSPYLTIPPGLSPTSLLDSPVMLSNSQALPSPTTGTFQLPTQRLDSIPVSASEVEMDKDVGAESSFMFKPHGDPISFRCLPGTGNQVSSTFNQNQNLEMTSANHQSLAIVPSQLDFEATTKSYATSSPSTIEGTTNMSVDSNQIPLQTADTSDVNEQAPQHDVHIEDASSQHPFEGSQRGAYPPTATGRPSEDGYNWRKYGQKQVKGSEYPRSYYKCTHQNCQVKKKIERSHDGQITEIIYKGGHNHPMPQPSRRSGVGSAFSVNEMLETGDDSGSYVKVEGGSAWRSIPQGSKESKANLDWRDGQERTSSTSVVTDVSDPLSTAQGKHFGMLDSADTPELSSTLASHDEEDDRATQGSISLGDDADDDESESKRRKKDHPLIESNMASRAVREPRVVVQTDSEVDILDDGYRWRKYGQKVVKGNPNPRSYYKCTSAGCSVRKHVERASHDLKYVITTYEGKHNHEVPVARNSSHMNSSAANITSSTSNAQTTLTIPRTANIPKPEPHIQDMMPRSGFGNEFFRPNNLCGYGLPGFPSAMPTYGLNPNHNGTHQGSLITQVLPDFSMSMPMNVNVPLSGYNFGKAGGVPQASDMRFVRPKQEQGDDTVYNSNASAAFYGQMMGNYQR
ncbi:hypothetical protein ACHQM5_028352 [Ranunculus cassubicifolius]